MKTPSFQNQPRKPRVEAKVKVRISHKKDDPETFVSNISKSGVFLETPVPFADVGEQLKLYFCIPNSSELVQIVGKVTRISKANQLGEPKGMALSFLKIEPRQARKFDQYLGKLIDGRGIGCRKYPRAKTLIVVELRTKTRTEEVIADNISNGGLFLRTTSQGIQLGELVHLVILHPSKKRKFMVDAQVVHLRSGVSSLRKDFMEGIGLQFVNITDSRRSDLSSFFKNILAYQRRGN